MTIMNSVFVTIYFFEWRWLIDFLAKVVLTSCHYSLVFLSNRSKLTSETKKIRSVGTFVKKTTTTTSTTKFWKWEQKTIKVGRTPIWGYLEFICYIIVWNIWKLKKFLLCAFGFANLDICWSQLMAVFILVCCTLFELFFWTTATTNLIRIFDWSSTSDF